MPEALDGGAWVVAGACVPELPPQPARTSMPAASRAARAVCVIFMGVPLPSPGRCPECGAAGRDPLLEKTLDAPTMVQHRRCGFFGSTIFGAAEPEGSHRRRTG